MFSTVALAPIAPIANHHDYRTRVSGVERSILPDSTPPVQATADSGGGRSPQSDRKAEMPSDATKTRPLPTTLFAALVIAGALPPNPVSRSELIGLIGSASIPPESMARLKDMLA